MNRDEIIALLKRSYCGQEVIDYIEKLESEQEVYICGELASRMLSREYKKGYQEAKVKYEKALDKACEELSSMSYEINMKNSSPYAYGCDYTKEDEWKEWCMNE